MVGALSAGWWTCPVQTGEFHNQKMRPEPGQLGTEWWWALLISDQDCGDPDLATN